jgi:hypothetical protein
VGNWKKAWGKDRRKSVCEDEVNNTITYTGVLSDLLRTMTEVKASPLNVGDTFLTKDRLLLRIVEKANLHGVQVAMDDTRRLNGDTFHVHGNFGKNAGWKVAACVVGIESISHPTIPNATAAEKKTSPAGNNNSIDLLVEIGWQEGNLYNTDRDHAGDDGDGNKKNERSKRQKTPMKLKYLIPLMKVALTEWPNISNK